MKYKQSEINYENFKLFNYYQYDRGLQIIDYQLP